MRRALRRRARPRRRAVARYAVSRRITGNAQPVFTETYKYDTITAGTGGVFQTAFNQIPEYASYGALYRAYRILKFEVIILPNHNTSQLGLGASVGLGHLVYKVNDMPSVAVPASENDLLTDNGCKIKNLTVKTVLKSNNPMPNLSVNSSTTGTYVTTSKSMFLETSAYSIIHNGISWWYSNNGSGANQTAEVYIKVTFKLRDPK